ncbi:hypothetical protein [Streptomyces sp. MP131-18]|uniref:hypothetical protein n=1 Tax=Streptomyces sp. MP131-18 TaxID=1857892 RepID=UPI0009D0CE2B|nr:hypothetical protein [Streptomyces sp. MP131-18]ONK12696.1 hypothetical protein STBA_34450 [Streptomyces sp. MP131-18]
MGAFDEEWAQLQAAAREEQISASRHVSGAGGANDRLAASSDAQRAAADYLETELLPDARREGNLPVDELSRASARMSGWACATGLRTVSDGWAGKVELLTAQLRAEAEALRGVSTGFAGGELETTYQFGQLGSLADGTW